jgi:hypothetical protein
LATYTALHVARVPFNRAMLETGHASHPSRLFVTNRQAEAAGVCVDFSICFLNYSVNFMCPCDRPPVNRLPISKLRNAPEFGRKLTTYGSTEAAICPELHPLVADSTINAPRRSTIHVMDMTTIPRIRFKKICQPTINSLTVFAHGASGRLSGVRCVRKRRAGRVKDSQACPCYFFAS